MEDFANEAVNLTLNGVYIGDKYFSFKISMLLFDAVAKAKHHTGNTILQRIPNLGLVTDVPLDCMHLICLGVVKKLLVNIWCFGRPLHKLQSRSINIISDALLIRRLSEESTLHTLLEHKVKKDSYKFEKEHSDGILIDGTSDPQFKEVIFSNFKLSINLQNSCCKLNCNSIIEISNFAYCQKLDQVVVIGRKYNNVNNLYTKPLNSSLIGIHFVDGLSECFSYWPLPNILHKLIHLPHTKGFVVMPLLHTEE
ncbi:hypothetical protein QTP88_020805 [Uroleucon formosanum]